MGIFKSISTPISKDGVVLVDTPSRQLYAQFIFVIPKSIFKNCLELSGWGKIDILTTN